ncbi:MAG: calcium-binding protein [Desulfamplus sp.]
MVSVKLRKFRKGSSVIVKPDVTDPDFKINLGGWQGRIVKLEKNNLVLIEWDSITLNQMPDETIIQSEIDGLDWTKMSLYLNEIELTDPRDTEEDVEESLEFLEEKHRWSHLGETGKLISSVDDDSDAWYEYLKENLIFPFDAVIVDSDDSYFEDIYESVLKINDKLTVLKIKKHDSWYGVLVLVIPHKNEIESINHKKFSLFNFFKGKNKKYIIPLSDLDVIDENSPNYEPVKAYSTWFVNRQHHIEMV